MQNSRTDKKNEADRPTELYQAEDERLRMNVAVPLIDIKGRDVFFLFYEFPLDVTVASSF